MFAVVTVFALLLFQNCGVKISQVALKSEFMSYPVDGENLSEFKPIQLTAGESHACSLMSNLMVTCWGSNNVGQLGDGTYVNSKLPKQVSMLSDIRQVASGSNFTCALKKTGKVFCWGINNAGQLGLGSGQPKALGPSEIPNLRNINFISAKGDSACAVNNAGIVYCWGFNMFGEIGDGSANFTIRPPSQVLNVSNVQKVAVGIKHACAILADKTVRCWGWNYSGQLGDGTYINHATSSSVVKTDEGQVLNNIERIAAGNHSTCAVNSSYQTYCWGTNADKKLGLIGSTANNFPRAILLPHLLTSLQVSLGRDHMCVLQNDNSVVCSGSNLYRQSNPLSIDDAVLTTAAVPSLSAVEVVSGDLFNCSRSAAGQVNCWGDNMAGQLGDGTIQFVQSPEEDVVGLSNAHQVSAYNKGTCAIVGADRSLKCWGLKVSSSSPSKLSFLNNRPVAYYNLQGIKSLSTGSFAEHMCAVTSTNAVKCWGNNDHGQLGNGTKISSADPVDVLGLSFVAQVTTGADHTCALLLDSTVRCWGRSADGQLGNGVALTTPAPDELAPIAPINGLSSVAKVNASFRKTCAILTSGDLKCWGDNHYGDLGTGNLTNFSTPQSILGINVATDVANGGFGSAINSVGQFYVWGQSSFISSSSSSNSPVVVSGISGATKLSQAGNNGCMLMTNKTVTCWGLGYKDNAVTEIKNLADVQDISVSNSHMCAVYGTERKIKCWGTNGQSQLGLNNFLKISTVIF